MKSEEPIKSIEPIFARNLATKLHGPGPSDVPYSVLQALRMPTIGHLDSDFIQIMDETKDMLRKVWQTKNHMTFPVSGTGSSGMQALCSNICENSEYALVVENGVFGRRITDCLTRLGVHAKSISLGWSETLTVDRLKDELYRNNTDYLFLVHADTSAGAVQGDMREISDLCHEKDILFIADMVTSLGGYDVKLDYWGVDAAFSGSQKCLSCPPGLAPVSLNEKAMEKVRKRKTKVPSWYFDITGIEKYWNEGNSRAYHHTAPINMIYALHESLRLCLEEGLDNRFKRHQVCSDRLELGLEALGFRYHIKNKNERTPMLHLVYLPGENTDEGQLRKELKNRHNIQVAGGLGDLAGRAWRIGIMGASCSEEKVDHLLIKIGEVLYSNKLTKDPLTGYYAAKNLI